MNLTFQKANADDFDRINELFVEMLRSIYGTAQADGYAEGDLDHYFSGGEDRICTAAEEGVIVAFLSMEVHREDGGFLYLDDFSVTETHRNRGIGTALLRRAEAYARERGLRLVRLHAEKSNLSAQRLYRRLGFAIEEEQGERLLLRLEL